MRSLILVALLSAAAGCDRMPDPPNGAPAPAPTASANAAAPDPSAALAAGKAYLDAARKHAETCLCDSDPFEGLIRDHCKAVGPEIDAVFAARAAVDALEKDLASFTPAAGAFLREAQLHAGWLADYRATVESTTTKDDLGKRPRKIRGGSFAYQRLARAWNAWHPDAPISAIAYEAYWPGGVREASMPLWKGSANARWYTDDPATMSTDGKTEPRYLPWIDCLDGPCLVGY
jgi:hypothetical protein